MNIKALEDGPQNVSRVIDHNTAAFLMFKEAMRQNGIHLNEQQLECIKELAGKAKPAVPIPICKGKSWLVKDDPVMQAARDQFVLDNLDALRYL